MALSLRHILIFWTSVLVLFTVSSIDASASLAADGDPEIEPALYRYELLCGMCMDLKERVADGERISKYEAELMIGRFLDQNKKLKAYEHRMSNVDKGRFYAIGRWFSTGHKPMTLYNNLYVKPVTPEPVSYACSVVPYSWSPARIQGDGQAKKDLTSFYILAQVSAPDLSYGLMVGLNRTRVGAYMAFRSNFTSVDPSYECTSDGHLTNGVSFWPGGNEIFSCRSFVAGLLVAASRHVSVYAGAGYGSRSLCWDDVDGTWAEVSDWSCSGAAFDVGVLLNWNRFVCSAGISTISFKTLTFNLGVGLRL